MVCVMPAKNGHGLTAKQEAFCQAIASGKNNADAYREAGYSTNMKDEVLWVKACELSKNGKVAVRIEELKAEVAEKALITREELVRKQLRNMDDAHKTGQYGASVSAGKAISAMCGYDAPEKHEHSGKDGGPINIITGVPEQNDDN